MGKSTRKTGPPPDSLPKDEEAEKYVLAAVLNGDAGFADVERALNAGDFSLERNRRIFLRMRDLHARGECTDRVSVVNELSKHNQLDKDGVSYLNSLEDNMPRLVNVGGWIRILKQKSGLRQIIDAAHETEKRAFLDIDEPAELIAHARRTLDAIGEADNKDGVIETMPSTWKYEDKSVYLVEELIMEGAITLWSGESGDGKSTLALALAGAVAQGKPFLGRAVIQRQVLYMDRENPIATVKDRLFRLGIPDIHERLKIWGTWWQDHYPPGPGAAPIVAYVRRVKPLIVWDSLVAFAEADENSATEMRHHMSLYRALSSLGASSLIIHHRSEKGESDYRGSSDIRAAVDAAWRLSRDDGSNASEALGRLVLKPYKTRTGPGKPIRIEFNDGLFLPVDGPARPPLEIVLELITCYPGSTQTELIKLAKNQGLGEHRLIEALNEAVLARKIEARRGKHNRLRYYPPPEQGWEASA